MRPDELTVPCPKCAGMVPLGNGVQRDGRRLHFWCAVNAQLPAEGEIRLPSGAYV